MNNQPDNSGVGNPTSPGNPLSHDKPAQQGSMNPGGGDNVDFDATERQTSPGKPLEENDGTKSGSMNPGGGDIDPS